MTGSVCTMQIVYLHQKSIFVWMAPKLHTLRHLGMFHPCLVQCKQTKVIVKKGLHCGAVALRLSSPANLILSSTMRFLHPQLPLCLSPLLSHNAHH